MILVVAGILGGKVNPRYTLPKTNIAPENWCLPGDSKWPFYPLVGGHLTFKRVTFSPSQKGHQQNCQVEDLGRWISLLGRLGLFSEAMLVRDCQGSFYTNDFSHLGSVCYQDTELNEWFLKLRAFDTSTFHQGVLHCHLQFWRCLKSCSFILGSSSHISHMGVSKNRGTPKSSIKK